MKRIAEKTKHAVVTVVVIIFIKLYALAGQTSRRVRKSVFRNSSTTGYTRYYDDNKILRENQKYFRIIYKNTLFYFLFFI